jgi:hypothetical protein
MKTILKTIALGATLAGLVSCGSRPAQAGISTEGPPSYVDPGVLIEK